MILRDYQSDIISDARAALAKSQTVLLQLSTGGGKTAIAGYVANSAAKRRKRVIFGVHRRELMKQTVKTFSTLGVPFGIIASGVTGDRRQPIQIASIPTLAKRLDWFGTPDLYIPDEAHHSGAATWADVFESYVEGGAMGLGLTATPERADGTGLGRWFGRMVCGPQTEWLIEQGYLSPYKLFQPSIPDLSGVRRTKGDLNKSDLAAAMGKSAVVGDAVAHYAKLAHGRKAMVFCASIKESLATVEKFQAAGYRAAHIDGTSENRDELIAAFEAGRIEVLSSVDLVSEGFDLPAIEVAILLRPTDSLSLFLQQVGRVLRPVYAPGFDLSTREGRIAAIAAGPKPFALILDHAGNSVPRDKGGRGHGLPDEERTWNLQGREKKKRGDDGDPEEEKVSVRQCPECFRAHKPAPTCPQCGHDYPTLGRTVEQLAGDLQEVDQKAKRAEERTAQARAKTLDDLVAQGKARKMRNPHGWARNVLKSREEKAETNAAKTFEDLVRIGIARKRKDPEAWARKTLDAREQQFATRYGR